MGDMEINPLYKLYDRVIVSDLFGNDECLVLESYISGDTRYYNPAKVGNKNIIVIIVMVEESRIKLIDFGLRELDKCNDEAF